MKLITRTRKVVPYDVHERTYGYEGTTEERYQDLVETTYFLGIPIWRRCIDTEHVPLHVLAELGTTGMSDWRSKFCREIGLQKAAGGPFPV